MKEYLKPYCFLFLIIILLSFSCSSEKEQESNTPYAKTPSTEMMPKEGEKMDKTFFSTFFSGDDLDENDCNETNNRKITTTDAIVSFDYGIQFEYNESNNIAQFNWQGDIVSLSIGGCDHMNYVAYIDSSTPTDSTDLWLEKAKAVTGAFFKWKHGQIYKISINGKLLSYSIDKNGMIQKWRFPIDEYSNKIYYNDIILEKKSQDNSRMTLGVYVD